MSRAGGLRALINAVQTQGKPRTAAYSPPVWLEPSAGMERPVAELVPPTPAALRRPPVMMAPHGATTENMAATVKRQLAAMRGESCP